VLRDPDLIIEVDPGVYAPAEDSFLMLSALEVRGGDRVLEMGCGSGFLSLHMAKHGAMVTAVDLDRRAVVNTLRNADRNGLKAQAIRSDLFHEVKGSYDLLVFNPPYLRGTVDSPDDLCWAGGESGVEVTARFLDEARAHMGTGCRVLILVSSDMDQEELGSVLQGWRTRTVSSRTVFFEELKVLDLTL